MHDVVELLDAVVVMELGRGVVEDVDIDELLGEVGGGGGGGGGGGAADVDDRLGVAVTVIVVASSVPPVILMMDMVVGTVSVTVTGFVTICVGSFVSTTVLMIVAGDDSLLPSLPPGEFGSSSPGASGTTAYFGLPAESARGSCGRAVDAPSSADNAIATEKC